MKCPHYPYKKWVDEFEVIHEEGYCLKEECAWWSNNSQQCYVGVLVGELYSLVEVMEEIRDSLQRQEALEK